MVLPKHALLLSLLLLLPSAATQAQDCGSCVLGLYDDLEMTRSVGVITAGSKVIYLGIQYGGATPEGLTGIEFSIEGLDQFVAVVEPLESAAVVLGWPTAPAPADSIYGLGGMNIAWADCLLGSRALVKITLLPRTVWPTADTVLRVRRKYPPSNGQPYVQIVGCDRPYYTMQPVGGGSYVLTTSVGTPTCTAMSDRLDLGSVPEGGNITTSFTVTNSGAGILSGVVSEACPDFSIDEPVRSYALARGQTANFTVRFWPSHAGEQTCTVATGTACASLTFAGRTSSITPIASIHANLPSFLGRTVTLEAQVTVPANYNVSSQEGWIQDASGRGLQVYGPETSSSVLFDTGNIVRITGSIQHTGRIVQLEDISLVTPLTTGNPPVAAVPVTAADVASGNWEGTFVQVTGQIVDRASVGAATRYLLFDGTGHVAVLVQDRFGIPPVALSMFATARGAASGTETSIHVGGPNDFFLPGRGQCPGRVVSIADTTALDGATVQVPIRVQFNPQPIDAFGLRLTYDGNVLHFVGATCCGLTSGWANCQARPAGRDTVILGGFDPTPIPANSVGAIMCLTFQLQQCGGDRRLNLLGLVDDLVGMQVCNGSIQCVECLSDGDINHDGMLTPGDAQCAFEYFLHDQSVPPECDFTGTCELAAADVNCDQQVTPGDALAIFERWLGGNPTAAHCFAHSGSVVAAESGASTGAAGPNPVGGSPHVADRVARTDLYRVPAPAAWHRDAGRIVVPIEMRALDGPAAFGLQIDFDPRTADFVGLEPQAEGQRWKALAAQLTSPGRLIVGGFDAAAGQRPPRTAVTPDGWMPLAELVFRAPAAAPVIATAEWREQILGDERTPGAEPLAGPRTVFLDRPYPNPARASIVSMSLEVPAGPQPWIEISVLDVLGRLVKRLQDGPASSGSHEIHWDRTDALSHPVAAGIYIVRMRVGNQVENHKLVVLR
jgi:hypothetical protein